MIALTNPPFIGTDNLSMSPVDTYTDVPFKWRVTKRVSRYRPTNHDHVESPMKKNYNINIHRHESFLPLFQDIVRYFYYL